MAANGDGAMCRMVFAPGLHDIAKGR